MNDIKEILDELFPNEDDDKNDAEEFFAKLAAEDDDPYDDPWMVEIIAEWGMPQNSSQVPFYMAKFREKIYGKTKG
ncbi:hypothetical protein [Yoonia sp.]|uniref:hypothetical protein n=1 Tax=Yoonia sp. TaxID=2212373 RepID=UPI00391C18A8